VTGATPTGGAPVSRRGILKLRPVFPGALVDPLALSLFLVLLALPSAAFAHRLDEYLQATIVAVEPAEVRLRINLTPGVAVAEEVLSRVDPDRDGVVTAAESAAYARRLRRDLVLKLDGREVDLACAGFDVPAPADLRSGSGIIRAEFTAAPGPLARGLHRLTLENWHLPMASAYLFNAARPNSPSVRISRQTRNDSQSEGAIEFDFEPQASPSKRASRVGRFAALAAAVLAPAWWARRGRGRAGGVPHPISGSTLE
jgi:hypothetical protein